MSFTNCPVNESTYLWCDRPGCDASLEGIGATLHARQRDASSLGYRKGWQLSHHGAGVQVDLCSQHVEPTLAMPMKITRLFDCYGREIPYKSGRRT